jgi:hypothetical protein
MHVVAQTTERGAQESWDWGIPELSEGETVIEPPNYDGPHVPVIIIMTSDNRTYVPRNLKGLLSSE